MASRTPPFPFPPTFCFYHIQWKSTSQAVLEVTFRHPFSSRVQKNVGSMGLHNDEDDPAIHAPAEANRSASYLPLLPWAYPHIFGYHAFKTTEGTKYRATILQG